MIKNINTATYLLCLVRLAIIISLSDLIQEFVRFDIIKVERKGGIGQLLLNGWHGCCVGQLVLVPVPNTIHD